MRKLNLYIIIMALFIVNIVYGQQKHDTGSHKSGNAIDYILESTTVLDTTMNHIYFSLPDENGLSKPSLILKNDMDDIIIDYQSKTILKDNFTNFGHYFSENLQYFGREKRIEAATQNKSGKHIIEIYQRNGTKMYEIPIDTDYEMLLWSIQIMNNGHVFAVNNSSSVIHHYDQNGALLASRDFGIGKKFTWNKRFTSKITQNNQFIALTTTAIDTITNKYRQMTVYLLDMSLNILFQKRIDNSDGNVKNVSEDGKTIIGNVRNHPYGKRQRATYIFDLQNGKEKKLENFITNESRFYKDDDLVMLHGGSLKLFYLPEQKELYHSSCLAFDYAPDAELVFVLKGIIKGVIGEHSRGSLRDLRLEIYDINFRPWEPVFKLDFGDVYYDRRGDTNISCTNDASEFILLAGDNIYNYKKKR